MAYISDNLNPRESIIHSARITLLALVPGATLLVLSVIGFFGGMLFGQRLTVEVLGGIVMSSMFMFPFALFDVLRTFVQVISTEYAITNQRVIVKTGLVRRTTSEVAIGKVEGISLSQSVLGRLVGYGTITVSGTGTQKAPFRYVANPMELRKQIQAATTPEAA